jgi:hypothetical protein
MGRISDGFGSEFHLLRYLGYHRRELNRAVEVETGGRVLEWLDFAFGAERTFPHLDEEWKGVDFVDRESPVESAWRSFWPQTGNVPNWDAVGLLQSGADVEFLLVEAKAHVEEIRSSCSAKEEGGLRTIREALDATIKAHGFTVDVENWLRPYYQYANRLAHLHFLRQNNIAARLIFTYFCGDNWRGKTMHDGKPPNCPKDKQQWQPHLQEMHGHLGLTGQSKLEERVHKLFLHV